MHVSSALNAIKKRGTFKAYKEAHEAYVEQKKVASKQRPLLPFSRLPLSETEPAKKSSKKEKASKKTKEGIALANAPAPELHNKYQAFYDKTTFTKEITKNKCEAAATKMFQFYVDLLSLASKYVWNKIVREQTEAVIGR